MCVRLLSVNFPCAHPHNLPPTAYNLLTQVYMTPVNERGIEIPGKMD